METLLPSGGGNMIQIPFSNMERWTHSGDSVILYEGWICMLDDKLGRIHFDPVDYLQVSIVTTGQ